MKVFAFSIPWEKYGLITELAGRVQKTSPQFGKTALQKLVYILKEAYNVPIGYDFNLYTYGPFSSELQSDLEYVAHLDAVNIDWFESGGYVITEGLKANEIKEQAKEFLKTYDIEIQSVVREFGSLTAKDLELRSTLIFVQKQALEKSERVTNEDIIRRVHEVKPHFSLDTITDSFEELRSLGVLS